MKGILTAAVEGVSPELLALSEVRLLYFGTFPKSGIEETRRRDYCYCQGYHTLLNLS